MSMTVAFPANNNISVTAPPRINVEVVTPDAMRVEVTQPAFTVNVSTTQQVNVFVSPTRPAFTGAGIWIQTGLGDGNEFEVWFEDGK